MGDVLPSGSERADHVTLRRGLSLFDITMIGIGAMIGAGIFVLTGEAAGISGPALIMSFALNGVVTIFTAMVYAELGSAIPEAGGGYLWIKEGLPGANAFLAGWMSLYSFTLVSNRGIDRQNRRVEKLHERSRDSGETPRRPSSEITS